MSDLQTFLGFYARMLGMKLLRKKDYPEGHFTLAFIGYGDESNNTLLELTFSWDSKIYEHGSAFGHLAISVASIVAVCVLSVLQEVLSVVSQGR